VFSDFLSNGIEMKGNIGMKEIIYILMF